MSSVIMNCGGQAAGPVKGMPFSAQEITEKRLILPNGSIGKESVTALITRDAEGRTRRELPPTLAPGQPPRPGLTMIADPIAGYLYLLHPDKTALRSKLPGAGQLPHAPTPPAIAPPPHPALAAPPPPSPQQLGERMIEGFLAHGTRTTTTVPALPGHPQPVQVITETWCAKELGAVLHNSHSDPRVGDVVTRLQGIQQMHPPGHLFQIPHDYRVLDSARPAVPHL